MDRYLFQSARLGFRPWKDDDLEPMSIFNRDPKVMEFFPSTRDKEQTGHFIESQMRCFDVEGFCFFAAEELESKVLVGFVGLMPIRFEAHFAPGVEIGWRLGYEFWGQGLATEGALANLAFAFHTLELDKVLSFTTITNQRSERVMQKIGMTKVGGFEHPKVPEGHPLRPHVLYEINRPA